MIGTRQTAVGRELERLLRDGVQSSRGDARLLDRYLDDRDESAFEAIVDRHGPMVLSVCRRHLFDPRDVEDAFQATFLILIRKASSLRERASLSSWLYGVAYRVALRARSNLLKRRRREGEADGAAEAVAPSSRSLDDSVEVLDAELNRLPEKYRSPLVLCYLEGRTHDQAAEELGWPVGTVRSRMAKARGILSGRLSRRGLDASACLTLLRPDCLIRSAILPSITSASTSWPATALAQGVITTMFLSQFKWIGAAAAAVGLLTATAGVNAFAVKAPGANATASPTSAAVGDDAKDSRKDSADDESKPTAENVQARILKLEQKIDRLTELLQNMEKRFSAFPAPGAAMPGGGAMGLSPMPMTGMPGFGAQPTAPGAGTTPGPIPGFGAGMPGAMPGMMGAGGFGAEVPGFSPPKGDGKAPTGPAAMFPQAMAPTGAGPMSFPHGLGSLPAGFPAKATGGVPEFPSFTAMPAVGGIRVIEAQLRNLKDEYARKKKLQETGAVTEESCLSPVRQARVLVARLEEMKDAGESLQKSVERLEIRAERQAEAVAKIQAELNAAKHGEPSTKEIKVEAELARAQKVREALNVQLEAKKLQAETKSDQLSKIEELIRWAKENFKELDDAKD